MAHRGRDSGAAAAPLSAYALLWGLVMAFGLVIAAGVALGLAVAFSPWNTTPPVLQAVNYGAIVLAGFVAARRARRWGWLHGGLVGVAYMLLASWAFVPEFQWVHLVSGSGVGRAVLVFAAGSLGGILGRF